MQVSTYFKAIPESIANLLLSFYKCTAARSNNANGNKRVIFFRDWYVVIIILSHEPSISLHIQTQNT